MTNRGISDIKVGNTYNLKQAYLSRCGDFYTLVGSGFESCKRQEFFSSLIPSSPAVWYTHPPSQWVLGRGMNLTTGPPSDAQIMNE
jgi:hypothetical protein